MQIIFGKSLFTTNMIEDNIYINIYRVLEKMCHYTFAASFAKCWSIFKMFSRIDLAVNV